MPGFRPRSSPPRGDSSCDSPHPPTRGCSNLSTQSVRPRNTRPSTERRASAVPAPRSRPESGRRVDREAACTPAVLQYLATAFPLSRVLTLVLFGSPLLSDAGLWEDYHDDASHV